MALARCCDAAGTLPHQKAFLTSLIWPGIEPSDWIEGTLAGAPVLPGTRDEGPSVEEVVAHAGQLPVDHVPPDAQAQGLGQGLALLRQAGLQLGQTLGGHLATYDSDRPLILLYKGRGWVFKDLYALLYLHLQMRDDSA